MIRDGFEHARGPRPRALDLFQSQLVSEDDNTLTVDLYDGTSTGARVTVAKSPDLRRTTYDGETINGVTYTYVGASERSATDGSDTETQKVTPSFVVGGVLYVFRPANGTGVTDVVWQDFNLDGRAWADVVS